jgi:hypothetical protein
MLLAASRRLDLQQRSPSNPARLAQSLALRAVGSQLR